jgi:hypothetical protein
MTFNVKWWNQWLKWKAGRRGTILGILAAMDIGYGIMLVLGFDPTGAGGALPNQKYMIPLTLGQWGAIWISVGIFLLTGVLAVSDRFQFAAAALLKFTWASSILITWMHSGHDAGTSPMVWVTLAFIVLLASGWPEPTSASGHWKPPQEVNRK